MFEHNTVTNINNNKCAIVYASKFTFTYGYHHYILEFDSPYDNVYSI
jgi:hypothetical protein